MAGLAPSRGHDGALSMEKELEQIMAQIATMAGWQKPARPYAFCMNPRTWDGLVASVGGLSFSGPAYPLPAFQGMPVLLDPDQPFDQVQPLSREEYEARVREIEVRDAYRRGLREGLAIAKGCARSYFAIDWTDADKEVGKRCE